MIDTEKMKALLARQREEAELSELMRLNSYSAFLRESATAIESLLSELEATKGERDEMMKALAECRDAMPERDSCDAELIDAGSDPLSVPAYVKATIKTLNEDIRTAQTVSLSAMNDACDLQQAGFDRCFEALGESHDIERSWSSLVIQITHMRAELEAREADRRDAKRYRWLRQVNSRDEVINEFVLGSPQDLDYEIDHAIKNSNSTDRS